MCSCFNATLLVCILCLAYLHGHNAATLTKHYGQRLTQANAYLPPTFGHTFGEKTTHASSGSGSISNSNGNGSGVAVSGNSLPMPENYEPNYTSYAPPASGQASAQYSRTQPSSKIPLSTLLPQSVIEQFAMPASAYETEPQLQQQQQQQQHQQTQHYQHDNEYGQLEQQQIPLPHGHDVTANELSTVTPLPILLVEEPLTMYLTASQNKTLEAAKLLASTLLEAQQHINNDDGDDANSDVVGAGSSTVDNEHEHGQQHGVATSDFNALNRTDIVVVKAHKNAYIIPAYGVARDGTRELYAKRNQLPKAYTINQFVFIIKPERINFLNKLV